MQGRLVIAGGKTAVLHEFGELVLDGVRCPIKVVVIGRDSLQGE